MNTFSRMIAGWLIILLGIALIIISPLVQFISLLYGVPAVVIGFFILFNKKEDEIEGRKDLNKRIHKK